MRYTGFIALLFFFYNTHAQGIEFFHGEWKSALEEAKKHDKLLFVDAYAQWCGPCKRMAKNVFTKAEVGDYYNTNFVNLKLDMETADGRTFGAKYPVSAFPTLFFLNGDGEIVKKVTGGQQVEQLLALGEVAIKSYDRSAEYAIKYEAGDRDYDLMINYIKELNKVGKPSMKISNDYLRSNPKITVEQKAGFLLEAVTESDSKLYEQLIDAKTAAVKVSTLEHFTAKVRTASFVTIEKAVEYDYPDLLSEAIANYKRADLGDDKKFEMEANMKYQSLSGNFMVWKELSDKYLKKYGKKDPLLYKQQLTTIKKDFSHDTTAKTYACEVCKGLVKKLDSADNYTGYIQSLIDCKKYEEARKITNEAIEKSISREEDVKQFEKVLKYLDTI